MHRFGSPLMLLQTLAMIIWKPNYKPYPTLLPSTPFQVGGAFITPTQVLILGVTAVALASLVYLVNHTNLGRAMRATAENPRVASLMGVKPEDRFAFIQENAAFADEKLLDV